MEPESERTERVLLSALGPRDDRHRDRRAVADILAFRRAAAAFRMASELKLRGDRGSLGGRFQYTMLPTSESDGVCR